MKSPGHIFPMSLDARMRARNSPERSFLLCLGFQPTDYLADPFADIWNFWPICL